MSKSILLAALTFTASLAVGSGKTPPTPSPSAAKPSFKKVMIVILENTNYKNAIKQPFMAKLAKGGALFTNFRAVTHPSQPNYIALVSGDTQGVKDDKDKNLKGSHIGDLLEAAGKTWKLYAEDYPGNCFKGDKDKYRRKHNPFISFGNVQTNAKRCANIVNASELTKDVQNNTLPDFSLFVPNMDDDGHDTTPEFADKWYERTFGPLLTNTQFTDGMLLITTFDEDENLLGFGKNQVFTAFYGAGVKPGSTSAVQYNHYSTLRTIEDAFGLGSLGLKDKSATPIGDVWQ